MGAAWRSAPKAGFAVGSWALGVRSRGDGTHCGGCALDLKNPEARAAADPRCAGSKVETDGGVFRIREDDPTGAGGSTRSDGIVKLGGSDKVPRSVAGSARGREALARAYHLASIKEGKVEGQQPALVNLTMPSGAISS